MSLSAQVVDVDSSGYRKRIRIRFTPVGNYPGAAGEPIDLTAITNPKNLAGAFFGAVPAYTPTLCQDPNGFGCELVVAAAPTLKAYGNLHFFNSGGNELAGAGYPAALLADFVDMDFYGDKGQV